MTYLYVAAGGAIGSVARAWLAIIVTRLTGPAFPWGTLLINILGSFIIGYVAAITVSDSRFPDVRAFVLVGVCGGFTTFSSFSLQTLDLIRARKPMQAAANVLLSVVLCLLAVTAGHYAAPSPASARQEAQRVPNAAILGADVDVAS